MTAQHIARIDPRPVDMEAAKRFQASVSALETMVLFGADVKILTADELKTFYCCK